MGVDATGKLVEGRDAAPRAWDRLRSHPSPKVDMTWHHTIPLLELRLIWNNLIAGKHWDAAREYLNLVGVNDPDRAITAVQRANRTGVGHVDLPGDIRDDLGTKLSWQGWNVVEGPGGANRLEGDDPGSNYEMWSLRSVDGRNRARLSDVDAVYKSAASNNGLLPYANNTALIQGGNAKIPSAAQAQNLRSTFRTYSRTLRNSDPIRFNEEMWEVHQRGRPMMIDKQIRPGVVEKLPGPEWKTPPIYRRKR